MMMCALTTLCAQATLPGTVAQKRDQTYPVSDQQLFDVYPYFRHEGLTLAALCSCQIPCVVQPSQVPGGGLGLFNESTTSIAPATLVAVMSSGQLRVLCGLQYGRCVQFKPFTPYHLHTLTETQRNLLSLPHTLSLPLVLSLCVCLALCSFSLALYPDACKLHSAVAVQGLHLSLDLSRSCSLLSLSLILRFVCLSISLSVSLSNKNQQSRSSLRSRSHSLPHTCSLS